jgi:hypothetical protein
MASRTGWLSADHCFYDLHVHRNIIALGSVSSWHARILFVDHHFRGDALPGPIYLVAESGNRVKRPRRS